MAVRRLAEIQPDHFDFTPENQTWVDRQIRKYPPGRQASAVMALLRRAQVQHGGWLPKPAIEKVADILGMPQIRALEIATFYTMYNLAPVGKFFIQFCGTTPCVLRGAADIKAVLESRIGASGHVTADGLFSWLEVECLGACCNAPMVQINDDYYEDLTPENFNALLDDLAAGRPVKTGSQIGRKTSEPLGGLTSLTTIYGPDGHEDTFGPPPPPAESPPPVVEPPAAEAVTEAPAHEASAEGLAVAGALASIAPGPAIEAAPAAAHVEALPPAAEAPIAETGAPVPVATAPPAVEALPPAAEAPIAEAAMPEPSAPDHDAAAAEHAAQNLTPEDLGHGGLHGPAEHARGRPEGGVTEAFDRTEDPLGRHQAESNLVHPDMPPEATTSHDAQVAPKTDGAATQEG